MNLRRKEIQKLSTRVAELQAPSTPVPEPPALVDPNTLDAVFEEMAEHGEVTHEPGGRPYRGGAA